MQLAKRLLGEGRELKIWDDNVSLGHLIGSNRQYIEEVIPHIGFLLCQDLIIGGDRSQSRALFDDGDDAFRS